MGSYMSFWTKKRSFLIHSKPLFSIGIGGTCGFVMSYFTVVVLFREINQVKRYSVTALQSNF